jgi:hypothetical protein
LTPSSQGESPSRHDASSVRASSVASDDIPTRSVREEDSALNREECVFSAQQLSLPLGPEARPLCPFWFADTMAGCKAGPECPFFHVGHTQLPGRPLPRRKDLLFAQGAWIRRIATRGLFVGLEPHKYPTVVATAEPALRSLARVTSEPAMFRPRQFTETSLEESTMVHHGSLGSVPSSPGSVVHSPAKSRPGATPLTDVLLGYSREGSGEVEVARKGYRDRGFTEPTLPGGWEHLSHTDQTDPPDEAGEGSRHSDDPRRNQNGSLVLGGVPGLSTAREEGLWGHAQGSSLRVHAHWSSLQKRLPQRTLQQSRSDVALHAAEAVPHEPPPPTTPLWWRDDEVGLSTDQVSSIDSLADTNP